MPTYIDGIYLSTDSQGSIPGGVGAGLHWWVWVGAWVHGFLPGKFGLLVSSHFNQRGYCGSQAVARLIRDMGA